MIVCIAFGSAGAHAFYPIILRGDDKKVRMVAGGNVSSELWGVEKQTEEDIYRDLQNLGFGDTVMYATGDGEEAARPIPVAVPYGVHTIAVEESFWEEGVVGGTRYCCAPNTILTPTLKSAERLVQLGVGADNILPLGNPRYDRLGFLKKGKEFDAVILFPKLEHPFRNTLEAMGEEYSGAGYQVLRVYPEEERQEESSSKDIQFGGWFKHGLKGRVVITVDEMVGAEMALVGAESLLITKKGMKELHKEELPEEGAYQRMRQFLDLE